MRLLLQGKAKLSVTDILDCFDWAEPHSSKAVIFFRGLLLDESVFDEARRLLLLRWCTGRNALSMGGLAKRITFVLDDTFGCSPDERFPNPHTCSSEIDLPPYSCKDVLCIKLTAALSQFERDAGFADE